MYRSVYQCVYQAYREAKTMKRGKTNANPGPWLPVLFAILLFCVASPAIACGDYTPPDVPTITVFAP